MGKTKSTVARNFEVDYAGAWNGHCISRNSACRAAENHIRDDGYTSATITDKRTGVVVARVRISADRRTITTTAIHQFKKLTP